MTKRTAIVTRSARGIGESIARRLAEEGYAVCINDISASKSGIDSLVAELNKRHGDGTAIGFAADVIKPDEVKAMIRESVNSLGPLTVMVANAGIAQVKPLLETSDDDVHNMFEVNFMGTWNCYNHAARQMIAQSPVSEGSTGYKIIGCASIVALKPFPMLAHYSSSKWAVRGLTQVAAMEWAKYNIQVNAFAPGIVGTKMWELIDEKPSELEGRQKGETIKHYVQQVTAMGRVSEPDDVGKVVGGFLCGKDSDFVTGQTIVVDGGIIFT